jgi:chromosomal replication initiation ATPase DnaA
MGIRVISRAAAETAIDRALAAGGSRPLAIVGPSGCGKSTLLRGAMRARGLEPLWLTGFELVNDLVEAIREDRLGAFRDGVAADPRPLVVEHLEDLKGKRRTQVEVQRLFEERVERGNGVLLTLTIGRGAEGVVGWLGQFAEVRRLAAQPRHLAHVSAQSL